MSLRTALLFALGFVGWLPVAIWGVEELTRDVAVFAWWAASIGLVWGSLLERTFGPFHRKRERRACV